MTSAGDNMPNDAYCDGTGLGSLWLRAVNGVTSAAIKNFTYEKSFCAKITT